ncbi:MAG: helix-turn-helix transcriptional regulator [Rhodospirillales bacterium]|nr:helix-turn-helix transcriptional regulator [Rhodospirillales bacterium]
MEVGFPPENPGTHKNVQTVFRECREEIGWSYRDIAERLGCSGVTVLYWEKGQRTIPPKVSEWLFKLAALHRSLPPPADWRIACRTTESQRRRPRLEPFYDVLRARVAEKADATITELRAWMLREHNVSVSHAVMWKALAQLGLTLAPPRGRARPS